MMRHLLCALLLLPCLPTVAQDPPNLVKNPGFEQLSEAGFAADWRGGEFGKPKANVDTDTTVARTGQNSMRLGVNPGSFVTCAAAPITCKPETTYYVCWWARTQDFRQCRSYLFFQTNTGQRVFPDADQYGTQDWTLHMGAYTTAADETWLHPVLTTHAMQTQQGGAAWFDDIGVYEAGFPLELQAEWDKRLRESRGVFDTAIVLSREPELTVWSDTLQARIYPEDGVPETARDAEAVSVAAARGEDEFFQVAIIPDTDLTDVSVSPGTLSGPGEIQPDAVRWWPVGYTTVKEAKSQTMRLGRTPDPLLDPQPVAAPAGQNTSFLIGIRPPRDAAAGTYTGVIAIQAEDSVIAEVPVSVRVFGFELPEDPVFRTLITFSASSMRPWDKRPLPEIEKEILRVLHDHGIRGNGHTTEVPAKIEDGNVVCDFATFDAGVEFALNELNYNAFFLGPMFGGGTGAGFEKHRKWTGDISPLSDEFNRHFPDYMRHVGAHLREKGWLDNAYVYLWDEPEADYFDKVVQLHEAALAGDPGLKIWLTTSPAHEVFWGNVKAWSVPFGRPHFDEQSVEQRRAAGDEIWVYNIPSALEHPAQTIRLWFWQAARYDAVGAQLWNVTFYRDIDPWEDITPKPYPVGRTEGHFYVYEAGQAVMLYPNPSLKQDPPVPGPPLSCLRLRVLQKGIDDFGYCAMLRDLLEKKARAEGVENPHAAAQARIAEITGRLVLDIGRWNLDTSQMQALKLSIAEEIERLLADG
ncbi:MAG TPA: hypothetical protein DGT21_16320 [Armatimonadetes bacterium]|nr:hypothetical protein [Armatimonadota bacterium]